MKPRKPPATKASQPSSPVNAVRLGFSQDAQAVYDLLPPKVQSGLDAKLREFGKNPNVGKPLIKTLSGYHRVTYGRIRAISIRSIASVSAGIVVVQTLTIGQRKEGSKNDPYELATAALRKRDPEVISALEILVQQAIEGHMDDDLAD